MEETTKAPKTFEPVKCDGTDCPETFTPSERFMGGKEKIGKRFCSLCIVEAQTGIIKQYNAQFQAIASTMGPDFMQNLLNDIAEGKTPSEVAMGDGTKAFVMDSKLFKASKQAGNRTLRRQMERAKKKSKAKAK